VTTSGPVAKQGTSLRRGMIWTAGGETLYLISQFGVLAALTWFGTLADVGRFGFASALTIPVLMFANLGLRNVLATDATGEFQPVEYFRLRLVSSLLAVPLMLVVGWATAPDPLAGAFVAIIGIAKAIESQSDIYYGIFQQKSRMDLVARSLILRGPATTILLVLLIWQTGSAVTAFASQIVCWSAVALLHDRVLAWRLGEGGDCPWDATRIRTLWRRSLPVGFANLLASLANNAPRLVIGWMLGLQALGIFTAVAYAYQAGMVSALQATNALSAPLSRALVDNRLHHFRRLLSRTAALFALTGVAGAAIAWLIGEPLLGLLFGSEYRQGATLLVLVLLAFALQAAAIVGQMGIFALRQFGPLAMLRGVLVVISFAVVVAGAWHGGLDGAGWGLVVYTLIQLAGIAWLVQRGLAARRNANAAS
jgi:O-antigen/teichoic acid export membrane protein